MIRAYLLHSRPIAVIAADRPRHLVVGGAIVLVHAVTLYGLLLLGPKREPTALETPIVVNFIAQPQSRPQWQPPQVKTVAPNILTPMPDAPVIESPVLPPSERAISVPVQQAAAVNAERVERSAPKLISSVEYVREPAPRYPPQSRKLREQGLVILRVLIDERGVACSIEVESSSGHARLDHAAREAVSRAAFRPYVEDGLPRRALVLIPIEFSLNRASA